MTRWYFLAVIQQVSDKITTTHTTWYVYLLKCADNSLYAGITTDLTRRLQEHNGKGKRAAKYTRVRGPVELVYHEQWPCRSSASKRESAIKKMTRQQKLTLISAF
ncbi:GIY-YIG nuclease family protein [Thalassotalea ponticola]|uniref:GIY-YIG nuclease family protein n=1 Tax=Thalassotalea ponticola TaxID=1523392 RepID=UPI0025B4B4D5|nr:GIY-YIG nuclease family protein [Thalassotalea ponticola]MDN3652009.1 GIY-YIG nuclease family protein [Thalassotalea ponticola]